MSAYQHRRNFSLLATQSQATNKINSTNRSLRKIQTNNNHSWLLIAAKQYYHKTSNLKAAINNFEEYLAHHPNHQESLYLCAMSYMHIEQYGKAILRLKQYLGARKANQASNANNRKLIINASTQLPSTSQVYLLLSMAYNKVNNLPKSMETINQALRQDNKFQQGYCFRAKLYLKMSQNEKAFYDYKQVLKFNPKCWEAWMGLGDYYSQINNYHQALKCYEKVKDCIELENRILKFDSSQLAPECHAQQILDKQSKKYNGNGIGFRDSQKIEQKRNYKINERLHEFLKRPKYTQITADKDEIDKTRYKDSQKGLASTQNQINPKLLLNIDNHKQRSFFKSQSFQYNISSPTALSPSNSNLESTLEIDLKMATTLYYLGQNSKSIRILESLLSKKAFNYYSEIFFYLANNQLKIYDQKKNSEHEKHGTKKGKAKVNSKAIMLNKMTIEAELTQITQNFGNYEQISSSELLQQVILNLESSIRSNNNKKVMVKACKTLIRLYIENNQFYQTSSVVQLAQKYQLDIKQYKTLSEVCMMVIKQKYEQALPILKRLHHLATTHEQTEKKPNDASTSQRISDLNVSNRQKSRHKDKHIEKQKEKCSSMRLSAGQSRPQRQSSKKNKANQFEPEELIHEENQRQYLVSSSGNERKQENNRLGISAGSHQISKQDHQNEFKNLSIRDKLIKADIACPQSPQPSNEIEWMVPLLLLFRAYSQYFSDNFIECLEIYEHYENYIKDYLGKEPENDIYLSYNKVMCEGILMLDNEMIEESLEKFVQCVENYYKLLKGVAVEPILFRVLGMIRLAISQNPFMSQQVNSRTKIYLLIIEVLDHYMPAIGHNHLVHYYYGLALYELEKYKEASDYLQKCLKIAEECTWKFLYVKGVIEIHNKLYKDAIRQFSAGLLVDEKPQFYLGRCICYIQLFEESEGEQQAFMEKSFEDLQKYIELEDNKQKISKWVTKILFFNKAYDQVTKSIRKVPNEALQSDDDMIKIEKSLNIYNGIFQDGGVLGQVIINAFQGKFEDASVEINGQRHQIILSDFVDLGYKKWLNILNLYSAERYPQLIKFLQMSIFQQQNEDQAIELRYNLAIVYYLSDESSKADNVIAGLSKYLPQIASRVQKFINKDFSQDQCVDDLQSELKGIKRLSSFLPYRKVEFNTKFLPSMQSQKSIYTKISLPFPQFFKPEIDLRLDDSFFYGETAQTCIPKKIEAPWIKKVTGNVQFTDNVIESHNTSLFDNDVLSPGTESKQQSSLHSSLKKF